MKLSKKFFEDLHKIGEWSFIEKNMWNGKLVPEIICDNLKKRGISQEDIEGCVLLTVEEAKDLLNWFRNSQWKHEHQCNFEFAESWRKSMFNYLNARIEQAEK